MKSIHREVATQIRQLSALLRLALAIIGGAFTELRAGTGYCLRLVSAGVNRYLRPIVMGPVKRFLLGRRTDLSVGLILASPLSTIAVAWWIGTSSGYLPLETQLRETLIGTQPHPIVFLGVAALLGLSVLVSAVNSGLIPTTLLVASPVFGAAVTKYGTTYTEPHMAGQVVSLPQAIEFATAGALLVGIPIALAGFSLGFLLRYGLRAATVPEEFMPRFDAD